MIAKLDISLFAQDNALLTLKNVIKAKEITLREKFNPQQSVSKLLREKSDFIDNVLQCCWQHFLSDHAKTMALCAVGGYGRQEMFPYSDIDIFVILPGDDTDTHQAGLSAFFTFLWDIGLKLGYSVRSVAQCVDVAKSDQTIMTSLLEIRLISGSTSLLKALKHATAPDKIWPSDQFFEAKMQEQQARYAKYHNTAYNLEPNVKEGPGGLRDRQVIAWVFKRHYNAATLKELIKYDFLPEEEYAELVRLLSVLWRIRYALHLLTHRAEDRLVFDYQKDLAQQFGFSTNHQSDNGDVECFMQFYFKTVSELERFNEMLLQLFSERFVVRESHEVAPLNADFLLINGYLEAVDEGVFKRNPLALLELFLILEQRQIKGVRATTLRLIRKNLDLIDDDFRRNKAANRLFIEAFKQQSGITNQLRRMNRYGVLAAYIPSFAHIVSRMQYDLFHIYTVDEHTLFVIRNLRHFTIEKHRDDMPFCNEIFERIDKPEVLYLAALFHDIAKGMQGDHSQLGEEIARTFCQQHDLPAHDCHLVAWLVRHHLIMSMTAQRKDISDPDVILEFAQKVGSTTYLNYLYLLTVADIRATNPELWNSWKDALLKELYSETYTVIRKGLPNPAGLADRVAENAQEAKAQLLKLGMVETAINQAWQHVSDDYFLRYSVDEIAWHTIAIASSKESELPLVLLRPQTQRGSAEVFVYTKNEGAIFSLSTSTLDQLGLTILDARIMTTSDGYVLNSFLVLEQSGEPIDDLFRQVHICKALRQNLLQNLVAMTKNIHRQSRQAKHFPIHTLINFHVDPLNRYTLIELITTDCAGLLSKIGQVFVQQHIHLHSAKITTIGSRVEDMFYITNAAQQPITQQHQLDALRLALLKQLETL
ncbi:MAG TPA: [protein-PII] uridylyltransferase [Methylococcaceae bacterium]|nr:[protein-PII] uridylyltransferase [Methylococcaceae bacterium]